jgi:Na+-translocating ferredoxin:NAD+ oxidoreductase subunit B
MANKIDAYQTIAEMWDFPESQSFRKSLEALFSREEAELLLELREPVSAPELAERLKINAEKLTVTLNDLVKRGIIYKGRTQYQFRRGVHFGFADPSGVQFGASEEYRYWRDKWARENPNREIKDWLKWFRKTGNPIHRVYPARLAIKSNPAIKKEDLLWHEDIEQIFQKAEIIVSGACGCRAGTGMGGKISVGFNENKGARCDHPLWNCFQFKKETLEFAGKQGSLMKVYTVEEALAKSDEAERAGLIHEGPGNAAVMPGIICSCASDCCGMLIQCQSSGENMHELYTPSRFRAVVDQDKCTGCQTCVERCSFGSIEMVKVPNARKMKAQITEKECYGCGVCVVGCEARAIRFDLVRPPEHIPPAEAAALKMPSPLK